MKRPFKDFNRALPHLAQCDSALWLFSIESLSQLYLDSKPDSATCFIQATKQYALQHNDSTYLSIAMLNQCRQAFYAKRYDQAKNIIIETFMEFGDKTPAMMSYYAACSYAQLDKVDSAAYFLNKMPAPTTQHDSVYYNQALALVQEKKGLWKDARLSGLLSNTQSDSIIKQNTMPRLVEIELGIEKEQQKKEQEAKTKMWIVLLCILIALLSFLGYVYYRWRKAKIEAEAKNQLAWLENELENMHQQVAQLQEIQGDSAAKMDTMKTDAECARQLYAEMKTTFDDCIVPLGDIARGYYENGNAVQFMKLFKQRFDECWQNEDFWKQIENHINVSRNNALKRFYEKHDNLTENEKHLLLLTLLNFDAMAISVCLNYRSIDVVYSMRNKLKRKLKIDSQIADYFRTFESR